DRWQATGWRRSDKKDVENRDLWERLLELSKIHQITWTKVKGHAGHELNERCDRLARAAAEAQKARRTSPEENDGREPRDRHPVGVPPVSCCVTDRRKG